MSARDKKLAVTKKQQTASPVPHKDATSPTEATKSESNVEEGTKVTAKSTASKNTVPKSTPLAKKLAKKNAPAKSIAKKPGFAVKLKAKSKKPVQIKPKIVKAIIQNSKEPDKKKLLKNGVKAAQPKKPKASKPSKKEQTDDDKPPVLEPIFPVEDKNVDKKASKKKVTKRVSQGSLDAFVKKINLEQKIKSENDDSLSVASDLTDSSTSETPKPKKRVQKKVKAEKVDLSVGSKAESLDEVMNDFKSLIKKEDDIKRDLDESVDLPKPDVAKVKRPSRKKIDLKSKAIKKENIENTLSKLDQAQCQTIDGLDLNVRELKKTVPMKARRHSIEKFPLEPVGADTQISVLRNLPPCLSPRTKRASKIRQSIEGPTRKSSPYMRSDSPARILRNGKHRRLKDINLLEGINISKKRKRLCSDLSGTESFSKFSGYDSDSSFSDLSSIHGAETLDSKDTENICSNSLDNVIGKELSSSTPQSTKQVSCIKKSEIPNVIDTNSNIYGHLDQTTDTKEVKKVMSPFFKPESLENISSKVPDKSLLLDIMKATFNDIPDDTEKDKKALKLKSDQNEESETCMKCEGKTDFTSTFECYGPIKELKDDDKEDIPLISPITPTTKEMEKSDDLKLDEIISKLEEAMDTEEITTPPQSTDVTLISNDIISTPVYPDLMKAFTLPLSTFSIEPEKVSKHPEIQKPVHEEISVEPEVGEARTEATVIEATLDKAVVNDASVKEAVNEAAEIETTINLASVDKNTINEVIENETAGDKATVSAPTITETTLSVPTITETTLSVPTVTETTLSVPIVTETTLHVPTVTETTLSVPAATETTLSVPTATETTLSEPTATETTLSGPTVSETTLSVPMITETALSVPTLTETTVSCSVSVPTVTETTVSVLTINEPTVDEPEEPTKENSEPVTLQFSDSNEKPEEIEEQNGASSNISKEPIETVEESEKKSCEQFEATQASDVINISEQNSDTSSVGKSMETMSSKEKEDIMQALGLQSLRAAEEAKQKTKDRDYKSVPKNEGYTGTLKTVIKLNRDSKKKKHSLKMIVKHKVKKAAEVEPFESDEGRYSKEGPSTSGWKHGGQSSDTAGAHRKSHYSNRSNLDGSSEHTSDGEGAVQEEAAAKTLVIPEKASSFSIHPGRVCKDECSYCFGKFGLFDTPCHIAQMKSVDRQDKILAIEKHLNRDSCLCDACYRHIDRKANTPSYTNKSYRRSALAAAANKIDYCQVVGCGVLAPHLFRRKWLIKIKRSVLQVVNVDLDNPGVHSIPFCDEHFSALEHLMICAMCKRRLARNHIHYLGPETAFVNAALHAEGITITLMDRPIVCKLCKCFATVILKKPEARTPNIASFFMEYKKRILHFNQIVLMDRALAEEPLSAPFKDKSDRGKEPPKKKRKLVRSHSSEPPHLEPEIDLDKSDQNRVPSSESSSQKSQSRSESPSDYMVDVNNLVPSIAMECGSDGESSGSKREPPKQQTIVLRKIPRPESVKEAVAISKRFKNDKQSSDIAVQRLGSNPSISVRQLFPGEEDLPVAASIEFGNVKEKTPEGWEKCMSTIQYDLETKQLWQELQKPYGNQSSFLRHLILLEKYFRNGDLILSPKASHHSVNYAESVQNRLKAYDNIPSGAGHIQPLSMIPFNKPQRSSSGIITSGTSVLKEPPPPTTLPCATLTAIPKNTPITIAQLNSLPSTSATTLIKAKPPPSVPGLIQLHPGTTRPVAPLVKPQTQKIKFPITKNWRPNLIPIDPSQKNTERKPGLVQVVSGGRPYHITLEDYKKMCAIKRNFEAKQKMQEAQAAKAMTVTTNSVLKRIVPGKGLVISKANPNSSAHKSEQAHMATFETNDCENSLEKLDKQVEKLEAKFNESKLSPLTLPKIPKSLTVIPQTVTRKPPSRPNSPGIQIVPKPKQFPKS